MYALWLSILVTAEPCNILSFFCNTLFLHLFLGASIYFSQSWYSFCFPWLLSFLVLITNSSHNSFNNFSFFLGNIHSGFLYPFAICTDCLLSSVELLSWNFLSTFLEIPFTFSYVGFLVLGYHIFLQLTVILLGYILPYLFENKHMGGTFFENWHVWNVFILLVHIITVFCHA